jgi:hypothetical protein
MRRVVIAVISLTAVLYGIYAVFHYGCLIRYTVGIPCPTCGMTRAWLAIFRGNLPAAFAWHPLFFIVPLVPLYLFLRRYLPQKRPDKAAVILLAVLFARVYLLRMLFLFPDTAPMDFNKNAAIPRLIRILFGR